jgi:type I restriction enzyme S subunit
LDLADVHQIEVFDGELERYGLHHGDLLVVEGNGSPDQIGRSAMWHGQIEPCVHQNHLIRVRPGGALDPSYLEIYWNSPSSSHRVQAVASSTSGLHTLSTGKLKGLPVVLPPVEEQARIVAEVERQMSFIEACQRAVNAGLARSAVLRRSVLKAGFEGLLVPQDPTDEPASVLLERIRTERVAAPKAKSRWSGANT